MPKFVAPDHYRGRILRAIGLRARAHSEYARSAFSRRITGRDDGRAPRYGGATLWTHGDRRTAWLVASGRGRRLARDRSQEPLRDLRRLGDRDSLSPQLLGVGRSTLHLRGLREHQRGRGIQSRDPCGRPVHPIAPADDRGGRAVAAPQRGRARYVEETESGNRERVAAGSDRCRRYLRHEPLRERVRFEPERLCIRGRRARDVERTDTDVVLEHLQHENVRAQGHAELETTRIDHGADAALLEQLRLAELDVIGNPV